MDKLIQQTEHVTTILHLRLHTRNTLIMEVREVRRTQMADYAW